MMKRKILTVVGLVSPLFLLALCLIGFGLLLGVGWWLYNPGESSKIIRIVSLPPLTTPQQTQPNQSPAPTEQPSPEVAASNPNPPPPQAAPATATKPAPVVSDEEVRQQLGFALPSGAVNSLTPKGVANRLVIPKLNLDAPVILSPIENQTWKVDHLGQTVGHLEGTAPPGTNSNIVLAGHVTLSKGVYGPFANLSQLAPGDLLYVYEGNQVYEYVVDSYQTVNRTAIEVTHPSETGQITLITCSNWNDVEGRYVERFVVKGYLAGG